MGVHMLKADARAYILEEHMVVKGIKYYVHK